MKVLVTGAGGMVGSHMIELLYQQGHEVLGTYYKPTTNIRELDPAIKMVECDVRYYQSVLRNIMDFQPEQILSSGSAELSYCFVESSTGNNGYKCDRNN